MKRGCHVGRVSLYHPSLVLFFHHIIPFVVKQSATDFLTALHSIAKVLETYFFSKPSLKAPKIFFLLFYFLLLFLLSKWRSEK